MSKIELIELDKMALKAAEAACKQIEQFRLEIAKGMSVPAHLFEIDWAAVNRETARMAEEVFNLKPRSQD